MAAWCHRYQKEKENSFQKLVIECATIFIKCRTVHVILPGCICCKKRAGSTLHWVARLDSTTKCTYSTCCTGTEHATFRVAWPIIKKLINAGPC